MKCTALIITILFKDRCLSLTLFPYSTIPLQEWSETIMLFHFILITSHPRAWVRREGCGTGTAGQRSRGDLGCPKEHHMPAHYNRIGMRIYEVLECLLSRCDMTLYDFQLRHPIWHHLQCYTATQDTMTCKTREIHACTDRGTYSSFHVLSNFIHSFPQWVLELRDVVGAGDTWSWSWN